MGPLDDISCAGDLCGSLLLRLEVRGKRMTVLGLTERLELLLLLDDMMPLRLEGSLLIGIVCGRRR